MKTSMKFEQEAYIVANAADKLPPCVERVRLRERFIRLSYMAKILKEMEVSNAN